MAALGWWRRAAAASVVVTMTSPFSKFPRCVQAADVLTLRRAVLRSVPSLISSL